MKLAVISDIHGNLPALQAVMEDVAKWQPDQVVVNGDTVNRGPLPLECWLLIQQQKGWIHLIGNHEEYILSHLEQPQDPSPIMQKFKMLSAWTANQMGEMAYELANTQQFYEFEGCYITHASIHSTQDGLYEGMPDDNLLEKFKRETTMFCTAHTHLPFIKTVENSTIINCGSVGQPVDDNTDASYAQLIYKNKKWEAKIARVLYDRRQTNNDYIQSGIFAGAGQLLWLMYLEWAFAKATITLWRAQYQEAVFAGRIELDESVTRFIEANHLPTKPITI